MKPLLATTIHAFLTTSLLSLSYAATLPPHVELHAEQQLVCGNGSEVTALDPQKVEGAVEANVLRNLLEGLVVMQPNGEIGPGVALRWETKDLVTWTFHLRHDARWSNGDPVTAEDFVYSWRRLVDPRTASPYATYLSSLQNAKAILSFTRASSDSDLLWPAMDTTGALGRQRSLHPTEWDNGRTVIERVTFLPIASSRTEFFRYRAGEIDITHAVPSEQMELIQRKMPNELHILPHLSTYYYGFNLNKPPFHDVRIRKALSLSLDRSLIVNQITKKGDLPAHSFTPPHTSLMQKLHPTWSAWSMERRIRKAKELMAEAGYSPQSPLKVTILYNTDESHKKIALTIASLWKTNLGVEVKLENKEWKAFLDAKRAGNFEITRAGWLADYDEPTTFLNCLISGSSNNCTGYANPAYDALLQKAFQTPREERKAALYVEAENMLANDVPVIPILHSSKARLIKPYVGGFPAISPLNEVYIKDLYIRRH